MPPKQQSTVYPDCLSINYLPCAHPRHLGPLRCSSAWSHVQNQPPARPAPLGPPRCSSAWSHVQNQPSARPAPSRATTLLVSVEPCSKPAACPPRAISGHHAARQRGAMFKTSRLPAPRHLGPPRCSSAWSHVQNQPPARPAPSRATTLLVSVEPCSKPAACPPRAISGHYAARQRGAMFKTSRLPAPRPSGHHAARQRGGEGNRFRGHLWS